MARPMSRRRRRSTSISADSNRDPRGPHPPRELAQAKPASLTHVPFSDAQAPSHELAARVRGLRGRARLRARGAVRVRPRQLATRQAPPRRAAGAARADPRRGRPRRRRSAGRRDPGRRHAARTRLGRSRRRSRQPGPADRRAQRFGRPAAPGARARPGRKRRPPARPRLPARRFDAAVASDGRRHRGAARAHADRRGRPGLAAGDPARARGRASAIRCAP